jgi:hypothetical protein
VTRVGDMAEEVARQLQDEHLAEIDRGELVVDEEGPLRVEAQRSVFARLEFSWRTSDKKLLEQIRAAADAMFAELFDDAITIMDELYASVRVADTQVIDGERVVKTDSTGRVLWQRDSRGREIEDWSLLTGQDLERALFDITRLKLSLAPQLGELLQEAVFAKFIANDASHDAYAEIVEGTIPDRQAYASRQSRQDRYHAFFRYWLWSQADTFNKELTNFSRILERVRFWRLDEQK